jgi:septal ring factor EnvC (AmiA/AmiB activator)
VLALAAPHHRAAKPVLVHIVLPRPRPPVDATPETPIDLSHALPVTALARLPPTAQQFRALKNRIVKQSPAVASARQKSETLQAQTASLKQKLIATAARIESLEAEKITLDARIIRLKAQDAALSVGFASNRIAVTRLLAILERLQHDMPPAMAVRPDDALAAARGAMLVGATLPPVYARAAALGRRIEALKATRVALIARRAEALSTSRALAQARIDLAGLLAEKEQEASDASGQYADLKARLDRIAAQAADLQALLSKVSQLRGAAAEKTLVTVTARNVDGPAGLARGSLLVPVVGKRLADRSDGSRDPGLTFATAAGAQVIAPTDGKVLFAGPYHKSGHVLILEITTGYDLVLAGMGRVTVRPGDELLAGEPVGTMPDGLSGQDSANDAMRLYFELRQNGHELNPAPWLTPQTAKARKI